MGTLGTGNNEAWIYDRRGERPFGVGVLKNTRDLRWTRSLNGISEASVDVMTGQHGDCCDILGKIGTWGFSLVMFRDGKRVWEGPITNIKWRAGSVSIQAHDVLGWTMRRKTSARLVTAPAYAVDELLLDVAQAFSNDDPNVLAWVQGVDTGTGPTVTRDVKADGGYYDDQLQEMVKGGANFTVVGRRIIVWPHTTDLSRGAPLQPAKHMSGDVEIEEDGMAVATRVTFASDDGVSATASGSGAVDAFYGLLDTVEPFQGSDALAMGESAAAYREDHYPAPVRVNVPQGSVLSCDAPYSMEELVPGSIVPVKMDTGLCRRVDATPVLSAVEVTDGAEGEKVSITLGGDEPGGIEGWMRRVERRQVQHDRRIRSV